jgi:hypothetical protein
VGWAKYSWLAARPRIASSDATPETRAAMWPYDRRLFLRSVATGLLLALGTWALIVVSDEVGSSAAMRAARLCALAPALEILAVLWVLEGARDRGEERAIAALGVAPLRLAAPAIAGAWLLGALASACVASPWADARSLFPTIGAEHAWSRASAGWIDAVSGARVDALGRLTLHEPGPMPMLEARSREALLLVLPLCLVGPLWASLRCLSKERWVVAFVCAALVVGALHAAAARRVSPLVLVGSALPLALHGAWLARRQNALRTPSAGPRPGAP